MMRPAKGWVRPYTIWKAITTYENETSSMESSFLSTGPTTPRAVRST